MNIFAKYIVLVFFIVLFPSLIGCQAQYLPETPDESDRLPFTEEVPEHAGKLLSESWHNVMMGSKGQIHDNHIGYLEKQYMISKSGEKGYAYIVYDLQFSKIGYINEGGETSRFILNKLTGRFTIKKEGKFDFRDGIANLFDLVDEDVAIAPFSSK